MRKFLVALAALVLWSSMAQASTTNETPGTNNQALLVTPCEWQGGSSGQNFITACIQQGWSLTPIRDIARPSGSNIPKSTVFSWEDAIHDTPKGLIMIAAHSSDYSFAIEQYDSTSAGRAKRDARFSDFLAFGYIEWSDIYKGTVNGGYPAIWITGATSAEYFISDKTFIYFLGCESFEHVGTTFPGSRVWSGYDYSPLFSTANPEADNFWKRMNGENGVLWRPIYKARDGLTIKFGGNTNTTLSPALFAFMDLEGNEIYSGYQVPTSGLDAVAFFDTKVDPNKGSPVFVNGQLALSQTYWTDDSTLVVKGNINGIGSGDLTLNSSRITSQSNSKINMARDLKFKLCNNDCPAAAVSGFTVNGTTASWYVDTEDNTAGYSIEGSNDINGPWSALTTVAAGVGQRSCTVGNSTYYRLVETETTGKQIVHGTTVKRPVMTETLNQNPSDEELRAMLDQLERQRSSVGPQSAGGERLLICSPAMFNADLPYLVNYLQARGIPVDVRLTDGHTTDAPTFQAWLDQQIMETATTKVMFIGDGNDSDQFSNPVLWPNEWSSKRNEYLAIGYPPNGQPANNLIPSWPVLCPLPRGQNMAWVTPYYFSDGKYVEHWPGVTLTRLPVSSSSELLAWVYKMQGYNQGYTGVHGYNVTTYVGDRDYDTAGDGLVALDAMNQTIATLPSDQRIASLTQSQSPIDWQRTQQASTLWATNRTEVAVLLSSASNRGWPGNYFDQTVGFNVGMLDEYHTALVMANSCDGADFVRTEDPHFGTPVCEKFLFDWSRGAVAWIGPTAGTWQVGNKIISQYLVQEIVGHPSRSMADGFHIAVQRVRQDYADAPDVLQTLDSYVFLGDPVSPLRHVINVSGAPDEHGSGLKLDLAQNAPNPFNPKTTINFTLPTLSPVSLRVYNVQGEMVRQLLNQPLDAGIHSVDWDGTDDHGTSLASGIYYYRLSTKGSSLTRAMNLVK